MDVLSLVPGRLFSVIDDNRFDESLRRLQYQAEVLRTVVDVIARNAEELGITRYIHHTLRDSCSAGAGLLSQFGLMTDDYAPKPAFHVYRDLIDAVG